MFYFQVVVSDEVVAIYSEIDPALEKAKYHLEDAREVKIVPVKMTVDEFLEATDSQKLFALAEKNNKKYGSE